MAVTVDGTVVEEEHLLLPEDRVLDEEKEHYPRAFSDGEIAYES